MRWNAITIIIIRLTRLGMTAQKRPSSGADIGIRAGYDLYVQSSKLLLSLNRQLRSVVSGRAAESTMERSVCWTADGVPSDLLLQ